jgi:lipopolysaccharide heptosyltransferase II
MEINKEKIKKILCIKPRGIGDIVLSTIILENIKHAYPEAKIDYLVELFASDALVNNYLINKVLTYSKKESFFKIISKIRKEKYDLVIDLYSNPRTAQMTFLSGAKYRVGYSYRGRKYAYNILASSERGEHHSAEHNLELIEALKIPIISKNIHFYLNDDEKQFGKSFIEKNFDKDKILFGIIPSGGWPSKRCDAEKWVEICQAINEKYNVNFIILWGPGDEADSTYLKQKLGENIKLAPETNIRQMAAIINFCDILIANDSGPMHIAAALNKPVLGLFGPTDPKKHGPYSPYSAYINKVDLFCIICNLQKCPYNHECFMNLEDKAVLSKFEEIIFLNKISISQNEKA